MKRSSLWRQMGRQRRLFVAGLVGALGLSAWLGSQVLADGDGVGRFWDLLSDALGGMAWPALCALAGATALAADGEHRSRLARARQGGGRLVIGWLSALLVAALVYFPALIEAVIWGSANYFDPPYLLGRWLPVFREPLMATAIGFLLLGVGACLGKLFRNDVAAACVSVALVGGGLWGYSWSLPRLAVFRFPSTQLTLVACVVSSAVFWIVAALLLHATEARGSAPSSRARALVVALSGMFATGLIVSGLFYYTGFRPLSLDPDHVFLTDFDLSFEKNALVVTAVDPNGQSPQIWKIALDGSGWSRLRPRMTYRPQWSPDGSWILYRSGRGFLGLLWPEAAEARAMRPDGTDDHLVGVGQMGSLAERGAYTPRGGSFRFASDGTRVLMRNRNDKILSFEIERFEQRRITAEGEPRDPYTLLGWSEDAGSVLLARGYRGDEAREEPEHPWPWQKQTIYVARWTPPPKIGRPARIWRQELGGGSSENLFEFPERMNFLRGAGVDAASVRFVPFLLSRRRGEEELRLLDLQSGEVTPLGATACPHDLTVSRDGRILAYTLCPHDKDLPAEVRLRNLFTGEDRLLAKADRWGSLVLSPSGSRLLRFRSDGPDLLEGGTAVALDWGEEWEAVSWASEDTVLLRSYSEDATRLAIGDLQGAVLRTIFP